nr:hypothetical protein [Tanacetum cinerariifolium]
MKGLDIVQLVQYAVSIEKCHGKRDQGSGWSSVCGAAEFQLGKVRCCMSWRQYILAMGLHTIDELDSDGFVVYWAESAREVADKGDLMIDMDELARLRFCERGGAQADPTLAQVLPIAALVVRTMRQRMARLKEEVHGMLESFSEQCDVLSG